MARRLFTFVGGTHGAWRVLKIQPVAGESLDTVTRVDVVEDSVLTLPSQAKWLLRGVTTYERYVTAHEHRQLIGLQPPLDRGGATCAALIPIKKSESWWQLSQDERRAIFEERSAHIATGLRYLPAVARRLHHSFELGEPFDFLTWFEYAPDDADGFEELVTQLRKTEEWRYVTREVDIRLQR